MEGEYSPESKFDMYEWLQSEIREGQAIIPLMDGRTNDVADTVSDVQSEVEELVVLKPDEEKIIADYVAKLYRSRGVVDGGEIISEIERTIGFINTLLIEHQKTHG